MLVGRASWMGLPGTRIAQIRVAVGQLQDLHISIIAVLIAQACNVGWRPLVNDSIPALREDRLKWVARHYIRPETLIAANARIVDFHAKLWLSELWGGGEVASIDGLRFVVPHRTFHARFNRRYFHRRRGVTALGTTADHYADHDPRNTRRKGHAEPPFARSITLIMCFLPANRPLCRAAPVKSGMDVCADDHSPSSTLPPLRWIAEEDLIYDASSRTLHRSACPRLHTIRRF